MSSPSENEQVVRDFCEAFSRGDIDEILGFFADGATYHNMPTDPAVGSEEIRAVLEMYVPIATDIEFEILSLATTGDLVLSERVDRMTIGDRRIVLPVAGAFEVHDGKLHAWRDYFDMQTFFG